MDNQNPMMNGGMPQNATPPQDQTNYNQAPMSSNVVVQPGTPDIPPENAQDPNMVNVQTQSIVESAREEAEKELEQVKAYNDEMLRRERAAEAANTAKRTGLTIFGIILGIAVVVITIWLVVNSVILAQGPADPGEKPPETDPDELSVIDGYKCTTTNCEKVVDLPDGRIIIRDTNYYIYDLEEREAILTTIENRDYHAITPFYWGERLLAELDPESDPSAIYNISENHATTGYNYDAIYHDIEDEVYKDQKHVLGKMIIVKGSGSYRFIDLTTGSEIVRGSNKVFTHGNFYFGYEAGNEIRAYTGTGKQFKAAKENERLYVKDKYVVYLNDKDSFEVYDEQGVKMGPKDNLCTTLRKINRKTLRSTLDKDNSYYNINH
jgi:hypothetical protein